jgi:hypothetical protein
MGWAVGQAGFSAVTYLDVMANHRKRDISMDMGMVVVIFISMMYHDGLHIAVQCQE